MNKNYLLFILTASYFFFSCGTKELKKVDKAEFDKIITDEHDRYMIYLDENIKKLQAKAEKDTAKIFVGTLFNYQFKNDNTYNEIQSYKRWDAYIKYRGKDGKMQLNDFHINYKSLKFEPVQWNYNEQFHVEVAPFVWHQVEIDVVSKTPINRLPIEHWGYFWLSPNDSMNSISFTNNIHGINFVSPTDTTRINIDFGSASKEALYSLIDSIHASGANFMRIKSYSND